MNVRRRTLMASALVSASLLLASPAMATPSASAHAHPAPPLTTTLADGLLTPLTLAVDSQNKLYFSQNFGGTLNALTKGKTSELLAIPGEVGAVSVHDNLVTFSVTPFGPGGATIQQRTAKGKVTTLANVGAFEAANNPDQHQSYGFDGLSQACAVQIPEEFGGAMHTGIVDSHPYATVTSHGKVYVADAAGNDILSIDRHGAIKVVAVLPPQPGVTVTAAMIVGSGLPDCVIGSTFIAEPVPTDVEKGPGHWLYVSTLPGGPEDPSAGARGAVYKVNTKSGAVVRLASGFAGATNLAVSPSGDVYVSELFGNQISMVKRGSQTPKPFLSVSMPGALEWADGALYATTDVLTGVPSEAGPPSGPPEGKIIKISLSKSHH